jgi:hypothetical protein
MGPVRTLAFHQPNFLPNLSFFYKLQQADVFAVVTQVQYTRRDWQNRVKVSDGKQEIFLRVPVLGSNRQLIRDARIDADPRWRRKLIQTLHHLYGDTCERELLESVSEIVGKPEERLADMNWKLIQELKGALAIDRELVFDEDVSGRRAELVIDLCRRYDADCYLSGMGGRCYMDDAYLGQLRDAGIECRFVDRNIVSERPYSALHYILAEGAGVARSVVHD